MTPWSGEAWAYTRFPGVAADAPPFPECSMRPHMLAVCGAVTLMALAVPSATTAATAPHHSQGLVRFVQRAPTWAPCGDPAAPEFECTSVVVPLDYRHP